MRGPARPYTRKQLQAAYEALSREVDSETWWKVRRAHLPLRPRVFWFGNPTGTERVALLFGRVWINRYGLYVGHNGYRFGPGGPLKRLIPFRPTPTYIPYSERTHAHQEQAEQER